MPPDPIGLLESLIRLPSHESEAAAADWLFGYLQELRRDTGIRASVRDIPGAGPSRRNVTAEWGTGSRSLIFNSHLDTVPPGSGWQADPFTPRIAGGSIYGLGAADAKGCLAAMLAAFESVARTQDPASGRLVLSAVGMEETTGRGSEAEVQAGLRADAVVIGEPTDLEVCVAHKGVLRMEATTLGRAAHASEPWEGANAISAMLPVVMRLDELAARIASRSEEPVGRASLCVTTIAGGTARNVVPARCVISLDRRLLPAETAAAARAEIEAAIREASGGAAKVEETLVAEAAATPTTADIVRVALETVARSRGRPSSPQGFAACCDMRLFRNLGGMPCIILGPGSLSQAHRADEHASVAEIRLAAGIYADIAVRWLGLARVAPAV